MSEKKYTLTSSQLAFAEKCMGRKLTVIEMFILAKALDEAENFVNPEQFAFNFQHSNDFWTRKYFPLEPFINAIVKIETKEK